MVKFKFVKYKKGSNIHTLLHFLRYIRGNNLLINIKDNFETLGVADRIYASAKNVIKERVYEVYESKNRTEQALNALIIQTGGTSIKPKLVLHSPAYTAPNIAGKSPGRYNYLAYFEDPVKFDSFIRSDDPLDTVRYRPFFKEMVSEVNDTARQETKRLVNRFIKRRMPRSRK